MSTEPEPDYSQPPVMAEQRQEPDSSRQLPPGTFVGREDEQNDYRKMLLEMAGARKGFFGSLMGSSRKNRNDKTIQSQVLLISGQTGSGKTRLAQRLRELAQKEKEYARRFRTLWLDWQEPFERDSRLTALLPGEPLPLEALLDIFQIYCNRESGGGYFEEYRQAIEETKKLAAKVQGAELQAVWEYRARALGKGLRQWSDERYLLFFMDNFQAIGLAFEGFVQPLMEESGSKVFFVLCGETLPGELAGLTAPERFKTFQPGSFSEADLLNFYEVELARYDVVLDKTPAYRSPETIAQLLKVTGGLPLPARISAFLLQSGLTPAELPPPGGGPVSALLEAFINGPLHTGQAERYRLYALALLRRPEEGLLGAMFDTRKDMLSGQDVLQRVHRRYSFLFEPGRPMTLHPAIGPLLRHRLRETDDHAGLIKVNERALAYLEVRLDEWSVNFPTLRERVNDLKWREWALDKVWHSFWQSEEQGWPESLALFTAGLGYRPALARQVVALLEVLDGLGVLGESGQRRLSLFRKGLDHSTAGQPLRELRVMGDDGGFFRAAMPKFESELAEILPRLLSQAQD